LTRFFEKWLNEMVIVPECPQIAFTSQPKPVKKKLAGQKSEPSF
jgi:hypothetical protein